jgi:5-formyltetrahydrofolate cyclo-ligase
MESQDAQNAKKLLRSSLSEARIKLSKDTKHPSMIAARLLELTKNLSAKTVAAYLPFGTEPNILGFIQGAAGHGLKLIMPVSQLDGSMRWVEYTGQSEPGIFGFEEPVGTETTLEAAELILIPASATDSAGNRLGKGKGFYDIALSGLARKIPLAAVVYDAEVLPELPVEEHDQAVDYVVTPMRIISTARLG